MLAAVSLAAVVFAAPPATPVDPLIARTVALRDALNADHPLLRTLPPVVDGYTPATLRTRAVLSSARIRALEAVGLRFVRDGGAVVRIGRVYAVDVRVSALAALSREPEIEWLESVWRPFLWSTLELAGPQIEADVAAGAVLAFAGLEGGEGLVVANMDTGVDLSHPGLFFADGGAFEWVDVDGDGGLSPGVDEVLVGDGPVGLSFVDAGLHHSNSVDPFGAFSPTELEPLRGRRPRSS